MWQCGSVDGSVAVWQCGSVWQVVGWQCMDGQIDVWQVDVKNTHF
jgi:hypothetical protein